MSYVFNPAPQVAVPVVGRAERFPVRRIYCVGRNYVEHAKEMGFTGREAPFFFFKPADATVVVPQGETGTIRTLGTLRVVRFESERELKAVDGTAFSAGDQQPIDIARPTVAQGVLEDSNVNAITEMTRLINVNRAYADIAKLVDEEHQRKRQAADTFTRQVTA